MGEVCGKLKETKPVGFKCCRILVWLAPHVSSFELRQITLNVSKLPRV